MRLVDIEIDKLTNSIENVITGDSFHTDVLPVSKIDLKNITKKNGWKFEWKAEFLKPERDVYKLTITNNTDIIQGLISLEKTPDNVYIHLLKMLRLMLGKIKSIMVSLEIWLRMLVSYHFNIRLMDTCLFEQKQYL